MNLWKLLQRCDQKIKQEYAKPPIGGSLRFVNVEELPGKEVHHFKGNNYIIITVARHTEDEELCVIYKNKMNPKIVYCRPLEMFMEEVDHKKYPNAKQKYRFEFVD